MSKRQQVPQAALDLASNPEELEAYLLAVHKMNKDLLAGMSGMNPAQARFLVDLYYQMQDFRIALAGQIRSQKKDKESVIILEWFESQFLILENQAKNALEKYAKSFQAGRWALAVDGIGPVIAAGLLAHVQVDRDNPDPKKRMNNPSKLQRFAGLDPTIKWDKGEKRPWNAKLKTLCYKLGESFVKLQNKEGAFYPPLFTQYKDEELQKNDAGVYTAQARHDATVEVVRKGKKHIGLYGRDTDAWLWVNGCYPAGLCQELQDISDYLPESVIIEAERRGESVSKARAEWCAAERTRMLKESILKPGEGQPMLPPSQIHARARRRVAKIFLVHFWEEVWVEKYNENPVRPWIFVHGGHSTEIYRPNPNHPKKDDGPEPFDTCVPMR